MATLDNHTTIGLLLAKLESAYQGRIWRGVASAAYDSGVNLQTFSWGVTRRLRDLEIDTKGKYIYSLITPSNVAGLIIVTSTIGVYASPDEITALCEQFEPIPVVTIGLPSRNAPCVRADNMPGMRAAVRHLIVDHGCRRIAFITGPPDHPESQARLSAYRLELRANGLPFNPALVATGDFLDPAPGLTTLLEHRNLALDALVLANDTMALKALALLPHKYHLRVPEDVAVIGFDNITEASHAAPPLSSVNQPVEELGRGALEVLLGVLAGSAPPSELTLPTTFVRRQSCGCHDPTMPLNAVLRKSTLSSVPLGRGQGLDVGQLTSRVQDCLQAITTEPIDAPIGRVANQLEMHTEALLLALDRDLRSSTSTHFIHALNAALESSAEPDDLEAWHSTLSVIRLAVLQPGTLGEQESLRVGGIFDQARLHIANANQRAHAQHWFRIDQLSSALRDLGDEMIAVPDVSGMIRLLQSTIAELGIPACHVGIWQDVATLSPDSDQPLPLASQNRLALLWTARTGDTSGGEVTPQVCNPCQQLLPDNLFPTGRPWHLTVHPLHLQSRQLGYLVCEVGTLNGWIYESLRQQLSSALHASLSLEAASRAYRDAWDRAEKRSSQLTQEIQERIRLERVRNALYRISEAAHRGTGLDELYPTIHTIIGELMPANNFYIARYHPTENTISFPYFVDAYDQPPAPRTLDGSLTGYVIRHRQPLLADPQRLHELERQGEVDLIGSPSLDWLGVPLISQGEIIGALVLQTYGPDVRYREEDKDILVFVSEQIAMAIARMQTEAEREELLSRLQHHHVLLWTASQVAKSAALLLDPMELVRQAVDTIQERFGFYYVGIFLVDPQGEFAVLRAGTGSAGQALLSGGHKLRVGNDSMVGWAIANKIARVAQNVETEKIRFVNPLLPDTRSELAVPLVGHSQNSIGALTVQSKRPDDFSSEDIAILQTMADQISIAIENARLYEQVQRYAAELEARVEERTARLAAINQELEAFSYSVSHDLRAPLRSIDGFSQALLEDYRDILQGPGQDYLLRLRRASQRMGHLIDDLLNLSRLTRGQLKQTRVDLSQIAREIVADLRDQNPSRSLEVLIHDSGEVTGDPRLLRIAIENLLSNAWKFTGRRADAYIEFGRLAEAAVPTFYVRDNGVGFDMAYATKLFGAFQRLHSSEDFEGNGIGLATVQRIIHRHGGRVWAESEVDRGATFYFTLQPADSA